MKKRLTIIALGVFLVAGVVFSRAVYLQILGDARVVDASRRQFGSKVLVQPRRGLILDRNNEPLAVNVESASLAANPTKIQNKKKAAQEIARLFKIPADVILTKIKTQKEFVWIKRKIPDEQLEHFKKTGVLSEGFWLIRENQRVYPQGELAAHVIGSVTIDSEGLEGVELWKNETLTGKIISMNATKDALGRPAFIDAVAAGSMQDGTSITLTIDSALQFAVEHELARSLKETGAQAGSVIVMNAVSGEILALANQPTFNPNQKSVPATYRRNRALTDGYEPGSILKPILVAAALKNGRKLNQKVFAGYGKMTVQGKAITEAEADEKFGSISLRELIKVSSNVGSAKLALELGADKFIGTLKELGVGSKSQVGFPGEIGGWVPPATKMQPLTLANIGFGQGLFVTPIQMVRAYAALLNGGWLVQPSLIKESQEHAQKEPPRRIFSQKVTDDVTDALLSVTEDKGTGIKARLDGFKVAGKTGTAQVVDPQTKKYSKSRYISSFVGFAVGVEPKLVILTALDSPKGVYYAAETAAPLFREILGVTANRFSIPAQPVAATAMSRPAVKEILHQVRAAPIKIIETPELEPSENQDKGWKMPDLVGLSAREVAKVLRGHDLNLKISGFGVVKQQSPTPGTVVMPAQKVSVTFSE